MDVLQPLIDLIRYESWDSISVSTQEPQIMDMPILHNVEPLTDWDISTDLNYNVPVPRNEAVSMYDLASMLDNSDYSVRPLTGLNISKDLDYNVPVSKNEAVRVYDVASILDNSDYSARSLIDLDISSELDHNLSVWENSQIHQYNLKPMIDNTEYSSRPLADLEISDGFEFNNLVSKDSVVAIYTPTIENIEFSPQQTQNWEGSSVVELYEGSCTQNKDFSPVDRATSQLIDVNGCNKTSIREPMEGSLSSTIDDYLLSATNVQTAGKKKRKPKQKKADKINLAKKKKLNKYMVKQTCDCKKKCQERIISDRRTEINNKFWKLDYISQKLYIRSQTIVSFPQKTKHPSAARQNVRYFFRTESGGNGFNIQVCQYFFLATLGFKPNNNTFVRNALENEFPNPDGRGKQKNKHKFDESLVIDHIMSFHPETSHYRREHAPFRKYLPSDVTVTKMHKLFLDHHPSKPCSYDYYRKVVDKLNISFTKLGHEKCEKCEKYHKHFHIFENDDSSCQECIEYDQHKTFYHDARTHYEADKVIPDDPRHVKVAGDQQKVVMVPRMEQFKEAIFTKRICVFNETFAPLGGSVTLPVFASLWHEGIAGRKKEDLISAYRAFLLYYRNAITITIWCDNCTSQNKCWALFCFMVYIINSNEIAAESITMKFLEKGHTFMSADSFHHQVELAMKHYEGGNVYDFDDFVKCVQSANSRRVVGKELSVSDFADWPDWTSTSKLNRAVPRPYIANMSKIKFVRGKKTMLYANSFKDDWIELDFIMEKHQGLIPPEMRTVPCGISPGVKEGIIRKLISMMPFNRRLFWYGIPTYDYTH